MRPHIKDVSTLRRTDGDWGLRQNSDSVSEGKKKTISRQNRRTYADPASVRTIPGSKDTQKLGQEI